VLGWVVWAYMFIAGVFLRNPKTRPGLTIDPGPGPARRSLVYRGYFLLAACVIILCLPISKLWLLLAWVLSLVQPWIRWND